MRITEIMRFPPFAVSLLGTMVVFSVIVITKRYGPRIPWRSKRAGSLRCKTVRRTIGATSRHSRSIRVLTFDRVDDAETFYKTLARDCGFSMILASAYQDKNGMVVYRQRLCAKQGHREAMYVERTERKGKPRPLTRFGLKVEHSILRARVNPKVSIQSRGELTRSVT